jgi:hypothetical protein
MTRARFLLPVLFSLCLWWGCDWSPRRDNPMDPGSEKYDAPPVIERLWIEVRCASLSEFEETCRLMIYADVSDREGISTRDSGWVYLEGRLLGQMLYEPLSDLFVLSVCTDCDTLDSLPAAYEDKTFVIRVQDDRGNIREGTTQITRAICCGPNKYPVAEIPGNGDVIDTLQPRFEWRAYNEQFGFTFRVHCEGTDFVWDSSGIPPDFTSIWIGPEDSLAISVYPEPYIWTVTVVDNAGNTATSEPNKFWVGDTTAVGTVVPRPPLPKASSSSH